MNLLWDLTPTEGLFTNLDFLFCIYTPPVPSPGQLQNRVQSVGNFSSLSRQPLKATAYVSPTIKGSASMPTSTSLQSLSSSSGSTAGVSSSIPLLSKPSSGLGVSTSTPTTPRSSLPRPASFVGTTSSTPRSKVAQPARRYKKQKTGFIMCCLNILFSVCLF